MIEGPGRYYPPIGINFHCETMVDLQTLSQALRKIAAFLQLVNPYSPLIRHADWWEHDGLNFLNEQITMHDFFELVGRPRSIYTQMPGDDYVHIGVSPLDNAWYLRFYATWDDDGEQLEGRFDITITKELADRFKREVLQILPCHIEMAESEDYYKELLR